MQSEEKRLSQLEADIKYLVKISEKAEQRLDEINERFAGFCDKCLVRKIVFGIIALMGATVVGALMTLILRAAK